MAQNFDLFGDPIPDNWGLRGRPQHIVTEENAFKVKVMMADGWTNQRIAAVLDITLPTLKRHYFSVLRLRDVMHDKVRAAHKAKVVEKALEGDGSAMRLLWQMFQREDLVGISKSLQKLDDRTGEPRSEKLGKKESLQRAAESAGKNSDWGTDLVPSSFRGGN